MFDNSKLMNVIAVHALTPRCDGVELGVQKGKNDKIGCIINGLHGRVKGREKADS